MDTSIEIKASMPVLEEMLDKLIKCVFDVYNYICVLRIERFNRHDLHNLKSILETIRNYHCPLTHNESRQLQNDSSRVSWIELHQTLCMKIRDHINDLQDDKQTLDFSLFTPHATALWEASMNYVKEVSLLDLHQSFYTRASFLRHHKKALALQCPLHHTISVFKLKRSLSTEQSFVALHKRIVDLYASLTEKQHELHTRNEPNPPIDFTML